MLFDNWHNFFQKVKSVKAPQITKNKDSVLDDILSKLEEESENLTEGRYLIALTRILKNLIQLNIFTYFDLTTFVLISVEYLQHISK